MTSVARGLGQYLAISALVVALVAGCAAPASQAATHSLTDGRPADAGVAAAKPAADFAVSGRLLGVKDGQIVEFTRGAFKTLAGGERYDSPALSPDGRRIAVSIIGDNHSDLVLLDSSAKRLAQLTDNWSKSRVQDSAWARHPVWSADGRWIAYVSDKFGTDLGLWSVDPAGRERRQLMAASGIGGVDWPTWSPNGRELVVTYFERNTSHLMLVSSANGPIKRLSQGEQGSYDAAWSPDATYIAYVARQAGRNDIWLMQRDGANPVRLTELGAARAPAWSPQGDLIAFVADRGQGFDINVMRPNLAAPGIVPSSVIKRLTEGQKLDAPSGLSWGP